MVDHFHYFIAQVFTYPVGRYIRNDIGTRMLTSACNLMGELLKECR